MNGIDWQDHIPIQEQSYCIYPGFSCVTISKNNNENSCPIWKKIFFSNVFCFRTLHLTMSWKSLSTKEKRIQRSMVFNLQDSNLTNHVQVTNERWKDRSVFNLSWFCKRHETKPMLFSSQKNQMLELERQSPSAGNLLFQQLNSWNPRSHLQLLKSFLKRW